jgi:hypothetical protein
MAGATQRFALVEFRWDITRMLTHTSKFGQLL